MMLVTETVILNIKQAPMKKYFPFKIRGVAKSMYLHPLQITDPQNDNKNDIVSEKLLIQFLPKMLRITYLYLH